jgi:aurora kinase
MLDFNVYEILGKGSFGRVVEVSSKSTNQRYALKIVEKGPVDRSGQQDQLLNEISILQRLSHPNIIRLYGYFEDQKYLYLILELADRETLYSVLQSSKTLSELQACKYIFDIASALAYLHGQRPPIVHRDIKPENVLLVQGMAKLGDFGSSNTVDKIKRETMCGTPEYLAPEMILKVGHNEKTDVWALGILLYELIVGETPFAAVLDEAGASRTQLFNKLTDSIVVV